MGRFRDLITDKVEEAPAPSAPVTPKPEAIKPKAPAAKQPPAKDLGLPEWFANLIWNLMNWMKVTICFLL